MKISKPARNAIMIGSLCTFSYFAVYIAKNILGALTPQMIEAGYSETYIASISSVYLIFYAIGQLINGTVGDKINAKWMIAVGLSGSGITIFVFSRVVHILPLAMLLYGMTGLFLSMVYGPMTKVVSENTEQPYTTRCSIGYVFASFAGSPAAGIFAMLLVWQSAFSVSSITLILMATVVFVAFSFYERRGIVHYGKYKREKKGLLEGARILLKHQIIKFSLYSLITGVVRTSVVFWLATYVNQRLGFSADESAGIFAAATFVIAFTALVSISLYEALGRDMNKNILLLFSLSTLFFILAYFITVPILNVIFMVLAIMGAGGVTSMIGSRYCPGLRDTGMVSAAAGYLDCLSYVAAGVANVAFANAVGVIGWDNLMLIWIALMAIGVIVALPYDKFSRKGKSDDGASTDSPAL